MDYQPSPTISIGSIVSNYGLLKNNSIWSILDSSTKSGTLHKNYTDQWTDLTYNQAGNTIEFKNFTD